MDAIQNWVALAGLIIGGTYLLGGLVVNLHLAQYGLVEYQIVRVKYLVVGLVYLVSAISAVVLAALPALFLLSLSQAVQLVSLAVSLAVSLWLFWLWGNPASHNKRAWHWLRGWRAWMLLSTLAWLFPLAPLARQIITPQWDAYAVLITIAAGVSAVLAALGQLYFYSRYIYGNSASFMGGMDPVGSGEAVRVQISGDPENLKRLAELGVKLDKPGLTEVVLLFDETDTHYILGVTRAGETRALKLTKELVQAILYLN